MTVATDAVANAHALLQRVQEGSAPAPALEEALAAAEPAVLAALPTPARSPTEAASVRDNPAFEHCGHTLSAEGRQLVLVLAEDLDVSELLCWELLLAASQVCG